MAIDYTKGMRPNLYELMQNGGSTGADKLNTDGSNADSDGFTIVSDNITMQLNANGDFLARKYDEAVGFPLPYIADPDGNNAQVVTLGFIREYTDTPVNVLHVTSAVDPVTQGPLLTCAESYDEVWEMVNNFHKKPIMLIYKDIGRITSFVVKEVSNTNSSVTVNYEKFDYYNNTLTYNYRYITVNDDDSVSGGSITSKTWSV